MALLISFKTSLFDPGKERPNPINPIAGESVLIWLRDNAFGSQFVSTEPDAEDWGWYTEVTAGGSAYLVGASGQFEDEEGSGKVDLEWMIQVEKQRSLKQKILGRNKLQSDDVLVAAILGAVKRDPAFSDVQMESDT